jgi:hypothetical protein
MASSNPQGPCVEAAAARDRTQGGKLSDILTELAGEPSRDRVSVADLVALMGDRACAAFMFIFALPNVLPTPPGVSTLLGTPLVILAAQLTLGRRPWLPKVITARSMPRKDLVALVGRVAPWLAKAERLLKPRASALARPPAEYAVGGICVILAVILLLPIPLGNMVPALAVCLFSLGILERDGIWILAGLVATAAAVGLMWGVVYALLRSAIFLIANAFG